VTTGFVFGNSEKTSARGHMELHLELIGEAYIKNILTLEAANTPTTIPAVRPAMLGSTLGALLGSRPGIINVGSSEGVPLGVTFGS
jgi:hypothetical protein